MPQTDNGYNLMTEGDYRQLNDKELKKRYGDDLNTSDGTFAGFISAILTQIDVRQDQAGYAIRNALLAQFAAVKSLDDKVSEESLSRQPASHSFVTLQIDGYFDADSPTIIDAGEQYSTADGHVFTTTDQVTIDHVTTVKDSGGNDVQLMDDDDNPLGRVTVQAYSVETGYEENVTAGSIINPLSSVDGFYSVTNPQGATGGADEETDEHLRQRYFFQHANYAPGSNNAIISEIQNVTGVQSVRFISNRDWQNYDKYGNPPKSAHLYVIGGNEHDVAQTLANQLYNTTMTLGQISVPVLDVNNQTEIINFDRASTITLYVDVELETNTDFNSDYSLDNVKDKIISYFSTLDMGSKVAVNRLYTLVFDKGVVDATITIGTNKDNLSASDFAVSDFQLPQVSADTVNVNIK